MGSIRELTKKNGSTTYHAEVRMKGQKPLRGSFRTRTLAKKWIQDTESSIRDGRYFRTTESRKHTVAEMIERFIFQWLPKYPQRYVNRSKNPNVFPDFEKEADVALRDIKKGEELSILDTIQEDF